MTLVRMVVIKRKEVWMSMRRNDALVHCWWECKLVQPLWKQYGGFLKLEQPYSPAILLLGIYPEEMERLTRKHICSSMFIAALFTIPKTGSLPRCPSMDEGIKNRAVMLSHFSCVWLFVILWIRACQAPVSGFLQARILEWIVIPSSRGSSWPRGSHNYLPALIHHPLIPPARGTMALCLEIEGSLDLAQLWWLLVN